MSPAVLWTLVAGRPSLDPDVLARWARRKKIRARAAIRTATETTMAIIVVAFLFDFLHGPRGGPHKPGFPAWIKCYS